MRQQLPLPLAKIPVLYVDDSRDSGDVELLEKHIERTTALFWSAASKLCPQHIGASYVECDNCIFKLDFFSFFPEALYALLERRYLIYIVDINADAVALNRWDHNAYEAKVEQFRDQLVQWFDLSPGALIDGEHHLIPAIWRLRHPLNPFVVWWSMAFEPRTAIEIGVKVSHIARKGKDLDGVLASGLLWLTSQVPNCQKEPLPDFVNEGQTDAFDHEFPVYIDFKNKRVRITTGVEIRGASGNRITSGLPLSVGPSIVRNIQGAGRGLPLRYLIRGGKLRKKVSGGYLLEANSELTSVRDQREKQCPECLTVRKLLEKKVDTNGDYVVWNEAIGVNAVSSVDLAWRHLLSAIVHLYVHSFIAGDDLKQFADTPLASEAQGHLTEQDALMTARARIASAQVLGQDEFGKHSGDLEMLWIPQVVSLAIDIESGKDADLANSLRKMRLEAPMEIIDEMLKKDMKGLPFFRLWFSSSDGPYKILHSLWEIEEGRKESRELKLTIFELYANAKSLHQQLSAER
jgi:hypothetical protein